MRERIARWIHSNERAVLKVTYEASPFNVLWDELLPRWQDMYRAKADLLLALIRKRIEEVPNPYPATVRRLDAERGNMVDYINVSHEKVEEFRQDILALFEKEAL